MSISDTITSVAASNPVVGVAVAQQNVKSSLLVGLQSGDTSTSALLDAVSSQAEEANSLMSSLMPHLGQNVNTSA